MGRRLLVKPLRKIKAETKIPTDWSNWYTNSRWDNTIEGRSNSRMGKIVELIPKRKCRHKSSKNIAYNKNTVNLRMYYLHSNATKKMRMQWRLIREGCMRRMIMLTTTIRNSGMINFYEKIKNLLEKVHKRQHLTRNTRSLLAAWTMKNETIGGGSVTNEWEHSLYTAICPQNLSVIYCTDIYL